LEKGFILKWDKSKKEIRNSLRIKLFFLNFLVLTKKEKGDFPKNRGLPIGMTPVLAIGMSVQSHQSKF